MALAIVLHDVLFLASILLSIDVDIFMDYTLMGMGMGVMMRHDWVHIFMNRSMVVLAREPLLKALEIIIAVRAAAA